MDPVIANLANKVLIILTPYAAKTAKEFVQLIGETGYEKAKNLFNKLRDRWKNDPASSTILENFEEQPEQFKPALQAIISKKLSDDQEFENEISTIIEEIGPVIEIIQKLEEAENVTGLKAGEVKRGTISISQEIGKGKNITGANIDRIG